MTTNLLDNLQTVAEHLDQLSNDWALIGGLAVSAYVEPRFTRDIEARGYARGRNLQQLLQDYT